ncbi:hypothetical protein D3C87_1717660 [compost metagenome]
MRSGLLAVTAILAPLRRCGPGWGRRIWMLVRYFGASTVMARSGVAALAIDRSPASCNEPPNLQD